MKNTADLKRHISAEHKRSPFSTYLREIVYGGTDGIITTFAIVASFSGAQQEALNPSIPLFAVLLFGFANIAADGLSMGIGNFLGVTASQDVYRKEKKREQAEIERDPEFEKAETLQILQSKGFSYADAKALTAIYVRNKPFWVEFMMRDELNMSSPEKENAALTAIATSISFVCFGMIPLVPYMIARGEHFKLSVAFTALSLLILGGLRFRVTGQGVIRSIGETIILGGVSAVLAYLVGTLFRFS